MKLGIKLGNIKIEELGLELGNIEVDIEYSLKESVGAYELYRRAIKELPETLEDLKVGVKKFSEIDNEFEKEMYEKESASARTVASAIIAGLNARGLEKQVETEVE